MNFASYWGCSPLVQFSKFKNFLWVCWFFGKNLSDFVPPIWKLHNPYCHTSHPHDLEGMVKKKKTIKAVVTFSNPGVPIMINWFRVNFGADKYYIIHIYYLHSNSNVLINFFFSFFFIGEIDVTNENVQDLLIAGDMIELREVVEICTNHLVRQLEPSNAIGIFRFAADHNCMLLREAALRYVCTNFVQVNNLISLKYYYVRLGC